MRQSRLDAFNLLTGAVRQQSESMDRQRGSYDGSNDSRRFVDGAAWLEDRLDQSCGNSEAHGNRKQNEHHQNVRTFRSKADTARAVRRTGIVLLNEG